MIRFKFLVMVLIGLLLISLPSLVNAVTAPSGIIEYIPITLNNAQAGAFPANAQILISFNALKYQQYETNTLNNTEFFFANATIIPSWLEGNQFNEIQKANTLYTSQNVLFWIRLPNSQSFLPGSASNIIYLGFAGNYPTSANMLFTGTTGEAPQLSCNAPANTITGCASGQYAKYDNGKNIFTVYTNFTGTSIPTGWADYSAAYAVNNGLSLTYSSGAATFYYASTTTSTIGDTLINVSTPSTYVPMFIWSNAVPTSGGFENTHDGYYIYYSYAAPFTKGGQIVGGISTGFLIQSTPVSQHNIVLDLGWNSTTLQSYYVNNTKISGTASGANVIYSPSYPVLAQANGGTSIFQWVRTRLMPPANVMPSETFGSPTGLSQSVSTTNPSNSISVVNQYESFTATITSDTNHPYSYNWFITNSVTNAPVANILYSSCSLTTNTLIFQVNSTMTTNSPLKVNVMVVDAISGAFNSAYTSNFYVYSALTALTISPSTTQTLTNGQSITFTSTPTGGATPLSYQWRLGSASCTSASTPIYGAVLSTYTTTPQSGITYYCLTATDNATTKDTITSSATEVIVTNMATISPPSNTTASPGQYESFNGITNVNQTISYLNPAQITATIGSANEHSIAINPAGTQLWVTDEAVSTVSVYSIPSYSFITTISVGGGYTPTPKGITFTPDGKSAWIGGDTGDTNLTIINTSTHALSKLTLGGGPREILFSPSGTTAYVLDQAGSNMKVVNVSTLTVTATISSGISTPKEEIFMNGTKTIWVTNGAGSVAIINLTSLSVVKTISVSSSPHSLAVTPNGAMVYVTDNMGGGITVINVSTQTNVKNINAGGQSGLVFTPDGSTAYILGSLSLYNISIFNVSTNSITSHIFANVGDGEDPVMNSQGTIMYFPTNVATGVIVLSVPHKATLNVVNSVMLGTIVYTTNTAFNGIAWSFNGILIPSYWATNSPLLANIVITTNGITANSLYTAAFNIQASTSTSTSTSSTSTSTTSTGTTTSTSTTSTSTTSTSTTSTLGTTLSTTTLPSTSIYVSVLPTTRPFIITNLTANQLPWNTNMSTNLLYMPNIIIQNMPWFFPLITLVLLFITDYIFGLKRGVETKTNFFAVALVYTMLSYLEVAGGLTTSGYFYLFEFIMLIVLFVMTLFASRE